MDSFGKDYFKLYMKVRPGITGICQISYYRDEVIKEEYIRLDEYYINNWSLWLDFMILSRTLTTVFRREVHIDSYEFTCFSIDVYNKIKQ